MVQFLEGMSHLQMAQGPGLEINKAQGGDLGSRAQPGMTGDAGNGDSYECHWYDVNDVNDGCL